MNRKILAPHVTSEVTPQVTEQVDLCERFRLPVTDTAKMEEFAKDRDAYKASQKKGRDSRFKKVALHRRGSTSKGRERSAENQDELAYFWH